MTKSSFKSSICANKIWNQYLLQFGNYALFCNLEISVIFSSFFIITFDWDENFKFWWFHRKDIVKIYQNIPYSQFKKYFFIYKNWFLGEKWFFKPFSCSFFFKLLSKFRDFINSDECMRKITSKSIRIYPVYFLN